MYGRYIDDMIHRLTIRIKECKQQEYKRLNYIRICLRLYLVLNPSIDLQCQIRFNTTIHLSLTVVCDYIQVVHTKVFFNIHNGTSFHLIAVLLHWVLVLIISYANASLNRSNDR